MNYDPCEFHGKFSDLIPSGFTFQKLYAANYRQYCYEFSKGRDIRVWQKNGGTIEVLGMSTTATKRFYSLIYTVGLEPFEYHQYYRWVVNIKTQEVEVFDAYKHDAIRIQYDMELNDYDPAYVNMVIDYTYDTYRNFNCTKKEMDVIKSMVDNGLVIP